MNAKEEFIYKCSRLNIKQYYCNKFLLACGESEECPKCAYSMIVSGLPSDAIEGMIFLVKTFSRKHVITESFVTEIICTLSKTFFNHARGNALVFCVERALVDLCSELDKGLSENKMRQKMNTIPAYSLMGRSFFEWEFDNLK